MANLGSTASKKRPAEDPTGSTPEAKEAKIARQLATVRQNERRKERRREEFIEFNKLGPSYRQYQLFVLKNEKGDSIGDLEAEQLKLLFDKEHSKLLKENKARRRPSCP
jgi:hypothetical protein